MVNYSSSQDNYNNLVTKLRSFAENTIVISSVNIARILGTQVHNNDNALRMILIISYLMTL